MEKEKVIEQMDKELSKMEFLTAEIKKQIERLVWIVFIFGICFFVLLLLIMGVYLGWFR